MASSMANMCTMGGSDLSGGVPMSSPVDAARMEMKLPMPPQPAVVHGLGMAGTVLGIGSPGSGINASQQMK